MPDPSPALSPAHSRFRSGVLFLSVLVAVLLFQTLTAVWTSDLGADPDEPAHAVTSLMVRDYMASGWGQSPLTFAQRYYEDFPKVALGHYPPVYYALAGVVLLPWAQSQVLLALQAVLIALLALQTYHMGRRFLSDRAALFAGILTASFPVTLKLSQLVMADLLLACLCLLAVEIWARFLEKPRFSLALLFGGVAASAILTKGSGLALALVPVVSILSLGRWDLLKKPAFWVAGLTVGVLAGPWMLYSSKITKEGMVSVGLVEFATGAVKYYAEVLPTAFGLMTILVALPGLALWLGLTKITLRPNGCRAALSGLLLGTALIMLFIPTGYSSRYFMPVVPVVAFLVVSLFEITLGKTRLSQIGLVSVVLILWMQVPYLLIKNVSGYRTAVLASLPKPTAKERAQWLVCADPRGEGAVIASAAFAITQRSPSTLRIHRGSKELSTNDWLGRGYKPTFATSEELTAWLEKTGVSRIFVDVTAAENHPSEHEELLLKTLRADPVWKLEQSETISRPYLAAPGTLEVYARQ